VTVVFEHGAQWSLEQAIQIPVVRNCAGPFGEELAAVHKVDEAAQALEVWSDRLEQTRPIKEKMTMCRYFSDARLAHTLA